MRADDRNPNTSAGDFEFRDRKNLSAFMEHFLLFFCVASFLEDIDVWYYVVGNLVRVNTCFHGLASNESLNLLFQFDDPLSAASRDCLIG